MDWDIFLIMLFLFLLFVWSINENSIRNKSRARDSIMDSIIDSVRNITFEHQKTLLMKRSQLLIKDDYGIEDRTRWDKELGYFMDNVVLSAIAGELSAFSDLNGDVQGGINAAYRQIEGLLDQAEDDVMSDPNYRDIEDMNPIEYEHYCAELLRDQGWSANVTKASGDQGVDVVATRGRLKIAVQCKLYAKPVGNKAVQEIRAGVDFVEADYGVVVAPKGFTRSAKELANKTGVRLMHHSELSDIVQAL